MSRSLPGSGGSTVPPNGPDSPQSRKSSVTPTVSRCLSGTGRESTELPRSGTSPTESMDQLPLFPGVPLVNPPALPGSEEAAAMTVGSGRSLLASLSAFYRFGSWQRTLLESLVLRTAWRSRNGLLAWKLKVMHGSHRLCIQLRHSVPTTGDTESSLLPTLTESDGDSAGGPNANHLMLNRIVRMLPTLTASDYGTNQGGAAGRVGKVRPSLQTMARLLPTLTSQDSHGHTWQKGRNGERHPTIAGYAQLLPTLTAQDHRSRGPSEAERKSPGLEQIAKLLPTLRAADGMKGIRTPEGAARERERRKQGVDLPTAAGGTLDPVFCEWYMGFEDGWTDIE